MISREERGALNFAWASAVIDQLVIAGMRYICVSPGFRNSPLILAAHKDERIRVVTVLDERGAAFCALGIAKRERSPVAVVSTSGTACANFFPAVLEARYSHASLVVITADRPQRLAGLGSNQTMDQIRLFGEHARFFANVEPPTGETGEVDRLRYVVAKAIHLSQARVKGPVHLNLAFEEPLLPKSLEGVSERPGHPVSIPAAARVNTESGALLGIKEKIQSAEAPLFLLGPGGQEDAVIRDVLRAAEKIGAAVIAEPLTSAYFHRQWSESSALVGEPEALLRAKRAPDLIVRFGPPLLSKKFQEKLDSAQIPLILFDELEEMRNPALGNATYIDGGIAEWAAALADSDFTRKTGAEKLRDELRELEGARRKTIDSRLGAEKRLTEWHALSEFLRAAPEGAAVFVGNSMPARDFCDVARPSSRRLRVFHNRGLSGIDGLVATACGVALDSPRPTLLFIGDLSLIHDLNSLAIAKNHASRSNLKIVLMNNSGGEIFRKLVASRFPEEWFTTPQTVDFTAAAKAFGIAHTQISDLRSLGAKIDSIFSNAGPEIVEILPDPAANSAMRA